MRALLLPLLVLISGCGSGEDEPEPSPADWGGIRPPNVVVVLLDTLRADALSFYGCEVETAPFLASLARDATLFEHAFSTSTWTAPATASVLTGCYPDRHGVTRGFLAHFREEQGASVDESKLPTIELHGIASKTPTLAERFSRLGYATYGLATNVNIGSEMEFDRGFDRFERHHQEPVSEVRERLLGWKAELTGEEPVFLYLHLNDVHEPYEVRRRFLRPPADLDDRVAHAYAYYESEIGYVDSFLGRLFGELGWGEDTLVAILADHGEEFMDHGQMAHEFSLYSELAHVPMMVFGPTQGVRPGRVPQNVSIIDVAPTLLDLIGRPATDLDGRSLAKWCRSSDKSATKDEGQGLAHRPLFLHRFERDRNLWGVIFDNWKLIQYDDDRLELYDLERDPTERTNLAQHEAKRCDRLLSMLNEHRSRGIHADSKRADVAIDEAMLEQLKALGYVK